ncbi:hypothetical protein B0H16DRAFT_1450837 [Mycena metata]|uniref:Uncharacterized protein n=1 Tax=Mycena metata TaxID=1033252 RepID=A0AAD7NTM8_9AGAR|nr:hypothetical protein B0H16DRAFT_1450837 [Mycena metata]
MSLWKYFAGLLTIYVTSKVLEYRANVRKLGKLPGLRSIFSSASAFGSPIPTYFWNPGLSWQWQWRNHWCAARNYASAFCADASAKNAFAWEETANLYQQIIQNEGWVDQADLKIPVINAVTSRLIPPSLRRIEIFIVRSVRVDSRCSLWLWAVNYPGRQSFMDLVCRSERPSSSRLGRPLCGSSHRGGCINFRFKDWVFGTASDRVLTLFKFREIEAVYSFLGTFMRGLSLTENPPAPPSQGQGKLEPSDDELVGNTFLILFAHLEPDTWVAVDVPNICKFLPEFNRLKKKTKAYNPKYFPDP